MSTANRRPGSRLLAVDAVADYVLGLPLLVAPRRAARLLALPDVGDGLYARVLGGVLTGIATALALESRRKGASGPAGLGRAGALVVNYLGAGALVRWLASKDARALPCRGRALLWGVASGVLAIAALESRNITSRVLRDDPTTPPQPRR